MPCELCWAGGRLPEKQNKKRPMDTGSPGQFIIGGLVCSKPVTVAPCHPTRPNRATEAKIPPTDRKDSSDRSRSHTVGSTSRAAARINVCRT